MDLSQVKLTKKEWASVEIPVAESEKEILRLIIDGYRNVNLRYNKHSSMLSFLKIEYTPEIECYLFVKYFEPQVQELAKKLNFTQPFAYDKKIKTPKKADIMRLQHMETHLEKQKECMFEGKLMALVTGMASTQPSDVRFLTHFYTLTHLRHAHITHINSHVLSFVQQVIDHVVATHPHLITQLFHHAHTILEKNPDLLRYADMTLYDHQKQLYQLITESPTDPKLVLYTAPTGTGKTLSPIGLTCGHRIIYICAARHVGLALAKSAISMEKCVAFAFGCETASDIRLHYFAAAEYTKNRKSGGIYKVDNSDGRKVEIMICDVASYLVAMYYMLNFNSNDDILLYWDEPTIGLDVANHPLHPKIHQLWKENRVSKIILSCATLPQEELLTDTLDDFREHFGGSIHTISSHDCKKSISLLDTTGKCVLPHLLFSSYTDIVECIGHCQESKALLRYFDLREIVRFVEYVQSRGWLDATHHVTACFRDPRELSMLSVKMYYLEVLKSLDPEPWSSLHEHMKASQLAHFHTPDVVSISKTKSLDTAKTPSKSKFGQRDIVPQQLTCPVTEKFGGAPLTKMQSMQVVKVPISQTKPSTGILLTTEDAHTLTDGPTIFIAEDVEKIGKFYLQQTKIPSRVLDGIMEKIGVNNQIQKKMDVLLKSLDDAIGTDESEKGKKMEKESFKPEVRRIMSSIEALRGDMMTVTLDAVFTPNTRQHQSIWLPDGQVVEHAFVPRIDERIVREIMELDVDNAMKVLLLLGIGVFQEHIHPTYLEIMKQLAQEQCLFLIIASSDYIYGTNYQLCHAFLGKDLQNMTQQKIIQALGRIGRGNIQQDYTVRFRDSTLFHKLFLPCTVDDNLEAKNMCRLLSRE